MTSFHLQASNDLRAEPDTSVIQQRLLNDFDHHVHNKLPAYLLDISRFQSPDHVRLGDIKLVSRDHISSAVLNQLEVDLRRMPSSNRKGWCNDLLQSYKSRHRYAILSHRWGADEPTFQMLKGEEQSGGESTAGIKKLLEFCRVAAADYGCLYAWSDTCCIDKRSSAELEEAIQSMYGWYRYSDVCIVHLGASLSSHHFKDDPWFRRGWTLQELLAPKKIKLYGRDWAPINPSRSMRNDKEDEIIKRKIEEVTGIPGDDIHSFRPSCDRISQKMNWMAPRKTKKTEDVAYSLIGIFDITMPISYGEGVWAFHRLMEVIAQRSFDPSFLAWCGTPSPHSFAIPGSPSCYKLDTDRTKLLEGCLRGFDASSEVHSGDPSYKMTKIGLQLKVLVIPIDGFPSTKIDAFVLPANLRVAIPIDTPTTVLSPARIRAAKPSRKLALGVVNYHPDRAPAVGHGGVSAGFNYFCLLLKRHDSDDWKRDRTENVVVLKCESTCKGYKVETVMLDHHPHLLPS